MRDLSLCTTEYYAWVLLTIFFVSLIPLLLLGLILPLLAILTIRVCKKIPVLTSDPRVAHKGMGSTHGTT